MAAVAARAAPPCEAWHAELLGVEGSVTLRRAGTASWLPAEDHTQLCFDDTIRSDASSRATVILPDNTMLRLDALTTMTLKEPSAGYGTLVDLLLGAIHVLSRDPRSLTIVTPHVNAGLEGTEFDVRIDADRPETEIAVLEGVVRVTNATGMVSVPSGNVAAAQAGGTPVVTQVRAVDLMRWASYYPQLFAGALPAPGAEPTAAEAADAGFFAKRAAARLRFGRVDDARADLAQARRLSPRSALASAVESVIALNRGDESAALAGATEARSLDPGSSVPLLALSYVQQAGGDLAAATDSIDAALRLEPGNALVWTRHAELALARGDAGTSIESATHATTLDARLAGPHTVLGFAHYGRPDYASATRSFERSIDLDPSAPLPRVGLGMALIADGDRTAGRRQLEIAATLDPTDALVRAYLSRAYDSEHRAKLTGSQLDLSKDFAPADPTAWLYDAISTRSDNRPVAALENLRAAASRNDDRALFRSRLFLDQDLASRSAGATSGVYRSLGFPHLGLLDGIGATAADPTDYAGHRQLADLYSLMSRSEIARISELQIANILEPATLVPVQPQLGQPSAFVADSIGPSDLATTELGPLVTENGLRLRGSTVTGANNTYGDDVALAGVHDRASFSVGQYRWHTDGFRTNNDIDQRIVNALFKYRAGYATSVVAELRSTEIESGDPALQFDKSRFTGLRREDGVDTARLGVRHDFGGRDTLLASVLGLRGDLVVNVPLPTVPTESYVIASDSRGSGLDVQEIHRAKHWRLQSGVAYAVRDDVSVAPTDLEQTGAYAYAHVDVSRTLGLTLGASADHVAAGLIDERAVNPKVGIVWHANRHLTLRAAAFETLEGSLTSSKQAPQPRLEPTEIAGFNQFLYASNGDAATVSGIGVDLEITPRSFAGVEVARRSLERPVSVLEMRAPPLPPQVSLIQNSANETQDRAYFYWTPTQRLSASAQYQYDRFVSTPEAPYGFHNMTIRRLPLEIRYFAPSGWTAGVRASFVHQEGDFAVAYPPSPLVPQEYAQGEDSFSVVDVSVGYRLPKRRGVLSLNVDNLLDEDFRFQDVDSENPSLMPERMAYLRFTFSFD